MKSHDHNLRTLTILIILFPLLTITLYTLLTYSFFYYSQKKERNEIVQNYKESFLAIERVRLKEKLNNLINFINYYDEQSSNNFKQNVQQTANSAINIANRYIHSNATFYHGYFLIFDKNSTLLLNPIKNSNFNFEEFKKIGIHLKDDKFFITKYLPKYGWYVVAVRGLDDIKSSILKKTRQSLINYKKSMRTNIYLLGIFGLISILLSLYLSYMIHKLLQNYKDKINYTNEQLIFQSRQALLGELFSMMAHQWRQPINQVASIVALTRFEISKKEIDCKEIDKNCEQVEELIEFMSETIDDFRTFYKPKERSELVNLKALIEQSLLFVEDAIKKKDIKVDLHLEDIRYRLYANEFVQVILNLIKNSIDAIEDDGKIEIRLYKEGKNIVVTVRDNGIGIESKNIQKVFDPYFTTKKDSMGLGLYMVKMILEKHMYAKISAKILKKGTEFKINFPL